MEPNITSNPIVTTPIVEPILGETTNTPPIVAQPIQPTNNIDKIESFTNKKYLGLKMEYIILAAIGVMISSYAMSIIYYRIQIKTSNTIASLQNQIDQLKLKQKETI